MSEPKRLEGWANVYLDKNRNEYFIGLWKNRTEAELHKAEDAQRIVRVTEIRDGESITVNGETVRVFKVGDRVRHVKNAEWIGTVVEAKNCPADRAPVLWADEIDGTHYVLTSYLELLTPTNPPMAPWSVVDDARKERDAAIERAEKAEAALQGAEFAHEAASKNAKGWHDRALSAESQLNDAAAKFERWAAVRLWAADISHAPGAPMSRAIKSAADLRSHYFPPAKEV